MTPATSHPDPTDRLTHWWLSPSAQRFSAGPLGGLALLLLALAVYLPGLVSIAPIDRDESRFAQASRQMFESVALPESERSESLHAGGLIIPQVQSKPRLNKPPLIYWLQTASAWAFTAAAPSRDAIWMYRIPSAIAALAAVLATWRLGCSMFDARAAWLAGVLLAVCPMVVWDAHQARADQLLLACTTCAMWALWHIWSKRESKETSRTPRTSEGSTDSNASLPSSPVPTGEVSAEGGRRGSFPRSLLLLLPPLLLALLLALGILTKGPITPMVVALTALTLSLFTAQWRWLRSLRPILILVVITLLVAPWLIAVAGRVGWGEYRAIIYDEVIARSTSAKESHWAPPGYHTILAAVLFWPGSLLTLTAFVRTLRLAIRLPLPIRAASGSERSPNHTPRMSESSSESSGSDAKIARSHSRLVRSLSFLRTLPPRWRDRTLGRDHELFLLAWIIPSWIVFELVTTKLPHYTLPMYPALALLTAKAVVDAASGALDSKSLGNIRLGFGVWLVIGLLICCAIPIGLSLLGSGGIGFVIALLTAAGSAIVLINALRALNNGWIIKSQLLGVLGATVFIVGTLGFVLPRARALQISPQLADAVGDAPVASVGYHEDSLVFLTRGRLEKISEAQATRWKRSHRGGLLIVPAGSDLFDPTTEPVGEVSGFNYSNGKFQHLVILKTHP